MMTAHTSAAVRLRVQDCASARVSNFTVQGSIDDPWRQQGDTVLLHNRRRERRVLVNWPVRFETSEGEVLFGHTIDITSLGVLLQSPIRLETPGVVTLWIEVSPGMEAHCVATLIHERAAPGGEWAYGAAFEHFFGTDRELLVRAIGELAQREAEIASLVAA